MPIPNWPPGIFAWRSSGREVSRQARRRGWPDAVQARLALVPAALILALCFYGCIIWTCVISFTSTRMLPRYDFVGFRRHHELWADPRFASSFGNLVVFGILFIAATLLVGLALAIAVERTARGRAVLTTIYLYPLAISWLLTGLVWQWLLNPGLGLEASVRALGWSGFRLDFLVREPTALYAVVGAGAWHFAGFTMALFLAGLRGIDPEIRNALRTEAVPAAAAYLHVILPMLRPYLLAAVLLLAFAVVHTFDLVVAMTGGGPGFATDLPTLFIYDAMFLHGQAGVAAAGAVALMASALLVMLPYLAFASRRAPR